MFQKKIYLLISLITFCNIYHNLQGMNNDKPYYDAKKAYWETRNRHAEDKHTQRTSLNAAQLEKKNKEINEMSVSTKIIDGTIKASSDALSKIIADPTIHVAKTLLDYYLAGFITKEEYLGQLTKHMEFLGVARKDAIDSAQEDLQFLTTDEERINHNKAHKAKMALINQQADETFQAYLKIKK